MKFAVGYQLPEDGEEPFIEVLRDYQDHIAEVYFPWMNVPTGRAALTSRRGFVDWTGQERLEQDLAAFKAMGLKLDLLLNANCYGGHAMSEYIENLVCSILDHLKRAIGGVEIVTTTSLAIARTVQRHFGETDVRASVNMRIGTVKGMAYVKGLFDSYHVQREYNRDLGRVHELKAWAGANGKRLLMLGNSGCFNFCSGQTFHDNMVAHEADIDETHNIRDWTPYVCWHNLKDRENWVYILQNSWIRPEDIHHYEDMFPVVKLATRQHANPRMVIHAYATRRFPGNLLDLFEPGLGPALAPYVIDNTRFPEDWFERTTQCGKRCEACDYCRGVLEQVLVRMPG